MRKGVLQFVALIAVAMGAGPAGSAIWQWSKTAGTNASADPTINWAEGMSPSSVNDSARAMMARVAEWRDDISGALTTGGTATAYTLTSNEGLNSVPTTGQLIAATMHATNGVSPTLTIDGGTTYPIQSSTGTAVAAGTLVSGSPYTFTFNGSAWLLRNFFGSPYGVPLGAMLPTTDPTAPNGNFVLPAGQCISRTAYAAYFAKVGTTYGSCDGVTTFGVPDMRGRVPVGLDNLNGVAAGRVTGTSAVPNGNTAGFTAGTQTTTLTTGNLPAYTPTGSVASSFVGVVASNYQGVASGGSFSAISNTSGGSAAVNGVVTSSFSGNSQGGTSAPFIIMQPSLGVYYILRIF